MVTFGLTLILGEAIRLIWGSEALQVKGPAVLSGVVFFLDEPFPVYRLFLAGAGIVVAIAIWQFLERTRLGLLIRATSQNAEMVHALGHRREPGALRRVRHRLRAGGLGGVLAAPLVTASLGMAANAMIDAFVIVIIGGMGSFPGSLIGALLVAFVQVFGNYYFPDLALAVMYLLMLLVLVVRPGRPARQGSLMRDSAAAWSGAACALALAPVGLPPFAMTLLTEALILGLFAMSLDLMVGYTRLISFGHAAAYGLGAYTCRLSAAAHRHPVAIRVIAAALFSGVVAIGVAWVCTLASGVSFSMLTLAFAQLLYAVAFKWTTVTGASDGLAGIPRRPAHSVLTVFRRQGWLLLAGAACLSAPSSSAAPWCVHRSARCCAASARTRRRRCRSATTRARYKIAVVAIAFALGGLAGALYAPFAGFANTELLFWLFSGQVLIMVIVGGAGTLVGPIIGAAFFMLVSNLLSSWTDSWALFFGLIFICFVLFAPTGHLGPGDAAFTVQPATAKGADGAP